MWRGGCIIRSVFLADIKAAFENNPGLPNLLLDPFFKEKVESAQEPLAQGCATALTNGIPVPAITSALCYFDGFRTERLPANLLQAQRDYFGAHTYERTDKPRGNSSIPTGQVAVAILPPRQLTMYNLVFIYLPAGRINHLSSRFFIFLTEDISHSSG
jgi:hypothetical protein